jgi:hypothetical protein
VCVCVFVVMLIIMLIMSLDACDLMYLWIICVMFEIMCVQLIYMRYFRIATHSCNAICYFR